MLDVCAARIIILINSNVRFEVAVRPGLLALPPTAPSPPLWPICQRRAGADWPARRGRALRHQVLLKLAAARLTMLMIR